MFGEAGVVGLIRPPLAHEEIENAIVTGERVGFVHASIAFRARLFRDAGGYDERYPTSEDYELMTRLAMQTRCENLSNALYDVRIHSGSKTFRMFRQQAYRGLLTQRALELGGLTALSDDQAALIRKETLDIRDLERLGIDEARISERIWGGYLHRIRQLLLLRETDQAARLLSEAVDHAQEGKNRIWHRGLRCHL